MTTLKKILIWALSLESKLIIKRYKPFIVAVTGSVGKTSTKDAIFDVLSAAYVKTGERKLHYVRKSEKSLNSEIGLPLTILGVSNAWHSLEGWINNLRTGLRLIVWKGDYPDCLILEVGADHPGDIKKVAKWLRPDIAVITLVSRTPVHVEFFKSPEQVFEEKASLAEAIKPGGKIILFGDDEKVMSIKDRVKTADVSVISFGMSETVDVIGSNMKVDYDIAPTGMSFDLNIDSSSSPVVVKGIVGKSFAYSLLAAAAVGKACGIDIDSITKALSGYEAPHGRSSLIPGMNGSTIIDDTYNSSPDAASAALETLKGLECKGSKIAVLADMMELGKHSIEEHRRIGREAATAVNVLITVGPRSRVTAEEAINGGLPKESVQSFDSAEEAAKYLTSNVKDGDIILVKGSQSMRMERVSAALLREPEKAATLLVRQEKEWLEKA